MGGGRLRKALHQGISVSVGVAGWDRQELAATLFARGDRALCRAKEEGGVARSWARELE